MRLLPWVLIVLASGCARGRGPSWVHLDTATKAAYDESTRAAVQVLSAFLRPGADYAALTLRLRPASADYRALFPDPGLAATAEREYGELWEDAGVLPVKPLPGQTQLWLWRATTDELARGAGDAAKFPGAYRQAAGHLRPGLTVYAWSFARPGEKPPPTFDGLWRVDGHWVALPRPWRVTLAAGPSPIGARRASPR